MAAVPSVAVAVVPYDPDWPARFAALAERVTRAFAHAPAIALRVEHVGSTAVPGLCAKPVIDLDVLVAADDLPAAIARLATLGYVHEGDKGIAGREAFAWPAGEARHHLYLGTPDASPIRDHLAFRDHLRAHPEVAADYAARKRELATRFAHDRGAYQAGKDAFVAAVTARARGAG